MIEHIPIGDRVVGAVPLRHPIAPGTKHPIEGPARGREIGAIVGADDLLDQRIQNRAGNAGEIVRSLGGGRLRREERAHRIARRCRHGKAFHGHVEIEIFHPGTVLHGVDDPQGRLDSEGAEILDVGRVVRLDRRLVDQELDRENLAVRQHPLAILDRQSRIEQQLRGACATGCGPAPTRPTPAARRADRTPRPAPGRGTAPAA